MSNSEYNHNLNAKKQLQIGSTEGNLPWKFHAISCSQLFRIKHLLRQQLEKDWILQNKLQHLWSSKFLRTGFISLWTSNKFFRIYLDINRSNNFDKIKPHMVKLISTESPKFYKHQQMTKLEFQKYSQIFLIK